MTRPRKSLPGRLSLFDLLPPPAAVPSAPAAMPAPGNASAPVQLTEGTSFPAPVTVPEKVAGSKHWYCVRDPQNPDYDLIAILNIDYPLDGVDCCIVEVPILGRSWRFETDWLADVFTPSMQAMRDYALSCGVPAECVRENAYTTFGFQGETRPVLRGELCRGGGSRLAHLQPKPKSEPPRPEPAPEALPVVEPAPAVPEPEAPAEIEPPYLEHGVLRLPCRPDGATQANWRCYIHPDGSYRDAVAILYRIGFTANVPTSIQCPVLDCRWDASKDFVRDCAMPFYATADAHAAGLLDLSASESGALAYLTMADSKETRPILRNVGHLDDTRPTLPAREAA